MALTLKEAVEVIKKEVRNENEKDELIDLAFKHRDVVLALEASDVLAFLRRRRHDSAAPEQAIGQKRASLTEVREVAKEAAEKVYEAKFKKHRVSVTNVAEVGETVLEQAEERSTQLFDVMGWADQDNEILKEIAHALKEPYKELGSEVQKEGLREKHVQKFSKKLYEVLQNKHARGKTVVGDTSAMGLGGARNKVDLVVCESAVLLSYVIVVHENQPTMSADQQCWKQATGQLVQRKDRILPKQPGRKVFTGVTMGYDSIDFWVFREGFETMHTGPLPLSPDASSPALQGMWRLWRTPNIYLGYKSPWLPKSMQIVTGKEGFPKGSLIDHLTRLDVAAEEGPGTSLTTAEVLRGVVEGTGKVVALKTGAAIRAEIENMRRLADLHIDGVIDFCGVVESNDKREWLVTAPVGARIDDGDSTCVIERFRRVAIPIGKLYESQLLHRDLSYSNLIATDQGPRIIDWRTLQQTGGDKQDAAGLTGTPLFMAISTLQGETATLSSELESLINILAHIATDDMLHWRHEPIGSIGIIDAKYRGWTFHFESNMMAKITDKVYADVIRNLQSLFFPNWRNRRNVTVDEFLEALRI